jgi:hypothetical protein
MIPLNIINNFKALLCYNNLFIIVNLAQIGKNQMDSDQELKALNEINSIFQKIEDQATRNRILNWAWDKYSSDTPPSSVVPNIQNKQTPKNRTTKKKKKSNKISPTFVKDLNLNPNDSKKFIDFVSEKKPSSNPEKCTISIYYLKKILLLNNITINHIYTCYKEAKWKLPSDLYNILAVTSSRNAFIDTSNMDDIQIAVRGENLVEHELPKVNKS